jgi:hypothetical protein
MLYYRTKSHMLRSTESLVNAFKPKTKEKCSQGYRVILHYTHIHKKEIQEELHTFVRVFPHII